MRADALIIGDAEYSPLPKKKVQDSANIMFRVHYRVNWTVPVPAMLITARGH